MKNKERVKNINEYKKRKKNRYRKRKIKRLAKPILFSIPIFVIIIINLSGNAIMSNYKYEINTLKKELRKEEIALDEMKIKILNDSNVTNIEENAKEKLNMDYPKDNSRDVYYNAGYDKWDQWNIVGELESVKVAINKAKELGKKNIAIYHDLKNIALWASGEWQAKNTYTQEYVKFMEDASKEHNICFVKVKAHSNESIYNDLADEAAKGAIIQYLNEHK